MVIYPKKPIQNMKILKNRIRRYRLKPMMSLRIRSSRREGEDRVEVEVEVEVPEAEVAAGVEVEVEEGVEGKQESKNCE